LPDNISGAMVWRNGWFNALKFVYPNHQPDLLVVKFGFNLVKDNWQQKVWSQQIINGGYALSGPDHYFYGSRNVRSADYVLEFKNYQLALMSGAEAEIKFSQAFQKQLATKPIDFLVVSGLKLEPIPAF